MTLFELTFNFFRTYLVQERGLKPNTVASYAEAVKQLLHFAAAKQKIEVHKLDIATFTAALICECLDHIEEENSTATRNQRLAALRVFFKYLGQQHPSMLAAAESICKISNKKTTQPVMEHLTLDEVRAFFKLAQEQPNDLKRARDIALFQVLYNTGARASEIVGLSIDDVDLDAMPVVTLTGKGGKIRTLPLWQETKDALKDYIKNKKKLGINNDALFLNPQRQRLGRFGLRDIVLRYPARIAETHPSLSNKSVTTHTFRHTTAFHLLRANKDLVTVKEWLGHSDINTTTNYCTIDPETKRKALSTFRPTNAKVPPCKWKEPQVLVFLTELAKSA